MDRRQFLELMAALPTLRTNLETGLPVSETLTPRTASTQTSNVPVNREGFAVSDLLASRTVRLGITRRHQFQVAVDDIESETFLAYIKEGKNALLTSAYFDEDKIEASLQAGALLQAVLAKLRTLSMDDYNHVNALIEKANPLVTGPTLSLEMKIPPARRQTFPVDDLIVAALKKGPSSDMEFEWVKRAFEIAEKRGTANLVVPCLGRNWPDRHTIEFPSFFKSFFNGIPPANRSLQVYFSFYSQWPSFELENATVSLNAAWRAAQPSL